MAKELAPTVRVNGIAPGAILWPDDKDLSDKEKESILNKVALGTSYQQFENFYFSPNVSISAEKIETASNASTAYKKQEGSYFDTLLNYSVSYDKTNSPFQPTDGFYS